MDSDPCGAKRNSEKGFQAASLRNIVSKRQDVDHRGILRYYDSKKNLSLQPWWIRSYELMMGGISRDP